MSVSRTVTGAPQPETPESAEGVSASEQVRRRCRDGAAAAAIAVVGNVFSSRSFRVKRTPDDHLTKLFSGRVYKLHREDFG